MSCQVLHKGLKSTSSRQEIAKQAGVNGTPTVQLFYDKELKQQWRGVKQRSEFKDSIQSLLVER